MTPSRQVVPFFSSPILIFGLLSFFTCLSRGQCEPPARPQAVYSRTSLPRPDFKSSVIYDGEDSILIFSGHVKPQEIYRFNLTSEGIQKLGNIPFEGSYAPLVRDQEDGSYLYFGNADYAQRVLRFDPVTLVGRIVAELPFHLKSMKYSFTSSSDPTKVYLAEDAAYSHLSIHEYDIPSSCLTTVTNITGQRVPLPLVTFGDHSYGFTEGGFAFKIQRDTREVIWEGQTNGKFSVWVQQVGTVVATTKYIYVLGGQGRGDPFPLDGILQYDPVRNGFTFIRIDGIPEGYDADFSYAPSMVFVERLNRIYFFGGARGRLTYYNMIWYIDVGVME